MAASRGGKEEGVLEGLKSLLPDIANLQTAPDAAQHMQFLQGLQQALVKYIGQQQQMIAQRAAQQQQQQAMQASGMGAAVGGGMRPGMPAQPGQPGGPPSQGSPGMAMPNPDELRRVLATQGNS
jgi:hypothetical protein